MHALYDTSAIKLMHQLSGLASVFSGVYQFYLSCPRDLHFRSFVYIPIGMSCNRDRLFPVFHAGFDPLYYDRRTENSSVQNGTDCSVGAFPHFFQIVLRHAGSVRRDGRTLYRYFIFLGGICRVDGHLVVRLIPVLQSQVIVFRI